MASVVFNPSNNPTKDWKQSDMQGWWWRPGSVKDQVLVRDSKQGFFKNGRVHVEGETNRQRLDRGLKIP